MSKTQYEKLDEDQRASWLMQPTTKVYMAALSETARDMAAQIAMSAADSQIDVLRVMAGEIKGINFALWLATRNVAT